MHSHKQTKHPSLSLTMLPKYSLSPRHAKKLLYNDDGSVVTNDDNSPFLDHLVEMNAKEVVVYMEKTDYAFAPEKEFLDYIPYKMPKQDESESIHSEAYVAKCNKAFNDSKTKILKAKTVPFDTNLKPDQLTLKQKQHLDKVFKHLPVDTLEETNQSLVIGAIVTQQFLNLVCKAGLGLIDFPELNSRKAGHLQTLNKRLEKRANHFVLNLIMYMVLSFTFNDLHFAAAASGKNSKTLPYKKIHSYKARHTANNNISKQYRFSEKEEKRFEIILNHFIDICNEIPISKTLTINLDKQLEDLQLMSGENLRNYLFRFWSSSAISTRFLGKQIKSSHTNPTSDTKDKWTHATLLPCCVIAHRFLNVYQPTKVFLGTKNKRDSKAIWRFHDVPADLHCLTTDEISWVKKYYPSLTKPSYIDRIEDQPFQSHMRSNVDSEFDLTNEDSLTDEFLEIDYHNHELNDFTTDITEYDTPNEDSP